MNGCCLCDYFAYGAVKPPFRCVRDRASENVFQHKVEKLTAKYETRLAHQDKKR